MPVLEERDGYCLLKVLVQPRASRRGVAGIHGDALKLKLTSPPVEGAANRECVEFIAKMLKTKKGNVEIIRGHNSRQKTLKISLPSDDIRQLLALD